MTGPKIIMGGGRTVAKFNNGVSIHEQHYQGYGGPAMWKLGAIYDNRVLETVRCESERSAGQTEVRLETKYSELTEKQLRELAAGKDQAFELCENCRTPCSDGTVHKGVTGAVASQRSRHNLRTNPIWCKACDQKNPGVIGETT